MDEGAFEAAAKLIAAGPVDQPLSRIVEVAMEASHCAIGFIAARQQGGHRILISRGIPLSKFREVLPPLPGIGELFSRPTIIEDAVSHPVLGNSVMVKDGMRFFVSAPLPVTRLPFPISLTCADSDSSIVRPPTMMQRLITCAAVAADEMRLIAEIAQQSLALAEQATGVEVLCDAVSRANICVLLVDEDLRVRAISPRLAELGEGSSQEQIGRPLSPRYFGGEAAVLARLTDVMRSGAPLEGFQIANCTARSALTVDAIAWRCARTDRRFTIVAVTDCSASMDRVEQTRAAGDSATVVSDFLLSTLLHRPRLLRRNDVAYHAIATWRRSIKPHQLAALRALKRDPGALFLARVADGLADAAKGLFGTSTVAAVAYVPCGNSGPHCLSARLAAAVAERLAVPLVHAFDALPPSGGSHPKGNLRRAAMRVVEPVTVPVLLIDDVATSGAHLEEAALLLRSTAPAVFPLVWIAD